MWYSSKWGYYKKKRLLYSSNCWYCKNKYCDIQISVDIVRTNGYGIQESGTTEGPNCDIKLNGMMIVNLECHFNLEANLLLST